MSKGQSHQAALLSAALTRKVGGCTTVTAVSVGTYSMWESTATLRLRGGARGAWRPQGRRGAGAACYKSCCTVDATKYYFTNRIVNVWNSLPKIVLSLLLLYHLFAVS